MKTRAELEMNLNWADENPTIFTEMVKKFMMEYHGWKMRIDATRKNYVTFIAQLQAD